jgi:hypothetical protein
VHPARAAPPEREAVDQGAIELSALEVLEGAVGCDWRDLVTLAGQRCHRLLRRHLVFVGDSFANHHYVGAHARLRRKLINSVAAGPDDAGF